MVEFVLKLWRNPTNNFHFFTGKRWQTAGILTRVTNRMLEEDGRARHWLEGKVIDDVGFVSHHFVWHAT
jgi:hypothetical protein